jgi:hypothetical protein
MVFRIKITVNKDFKSEKQEKQFDEIFAKYDKEYKTFGEMKKAAEELDRALI